MAVQAEQRTSMAPGPGHWEADHTHWPRPATRLYTELQPAPFRAGFAASFARYGLLLETLACEWVDGIAYTQPQPVPAEQVPARAAAAARAFETRVWREDVRRWDEEDKPAAIAAHRALQAVEPADLPLPELLEHVDRCCEHLQAMTELHHRYSGTAILVVGDFLAHASAWTQADGGRLLALVAGSAPASRGDADGLGRLVAALAADAGARAVLDREEAPAATLAALRALPGEAGAAARAHLDLVLHRPIDGLDLGEPCGVERPAVLLGAIRARLTADRAAPPPPDPAAVRAEVPAAERERFDELLAEARTAHRLRDERGLYSDVWAIGLLRRALLAGGARLAAAGRLLAAEHLVEAGRAEVHALLTGAGGPDAAELAGRAADRAVRRSTDAPPSLGDAPAGPPPLDALPAPAARAMRALLTGIGAIFGDADTPSDDAVVRGFAASAGGYEGTARVVAGPGELDRLRPGDVLVTQSTGEAFNVALPLVGAIVTDRGGVLSHAAIVAREFGVPAVVGARDATARIPDGARVRVDGDAGEVRVLP